MKPFHEVGIPLDDLLSKLDDLVQVIDLKGHILYANNKFLTCLGYSKDDVVNLNFFADIVSKPYFRMLKSTLNQLHENDDIEGVHLSLMTESNTEIMVDGQFIARRVDGQLQSVVCILREIPHAHTELNRMFAMSVDMLGVVDFDGKFINLNPSWERILGYSLDELLGQEFLSFVHPDDLEMTKREASRSVQVDTVQNFENRYLCKDGSIKRISWHYISHLDIGQTYFVARDVTEERHNQDLLKEARDQLQAILDNSGTMIGLKDLQGQYILVNQEFADIFGDGNKSYLLGKQDTDLFSDKVATILIEHDDAVLHSQRSLQFEEHIPTSDGLRTYLTTRFLLLDNSDTPYAICMIAKDITYRKLTEMQLLMRNQAIEHSPSGISIADARLPDLPLIYINPAFEKTTGYSALDVIGRNCRFLQGNERNQDGVLEIRHAIDNEQPVTVVIRNYRKNGELFYNELSLAPIHNDVGELTHYVGICTDVTARMEFETKIQNQNQKLVQTNADLAVARKQAEDATRLKSQFLATMSHELRTPLNAIIGYTEIQLAGMTGDITEEQRDYQERVLTNADHLLNLINDVLDLSKIEAGRLELVRKVFNIRDWVSDIDDQMRGLADEKSLVFYVEVDTRMPDFIVGDPARIKQVVINLISNAVKFTAEGSVRFIIRKHGRDAWRIIVEDTGIGIPSHMQETIFEEFRQVDSSSRRKSGGTGLGLAIVRKLLLMMAGSVRLSSQVGKGSAFTITLPLIKDTYANKYDI
ncbi:MAG: hypothetical protein Phog2KO_03030 [Phototrophicaceae bacterium]